MEKYRFLVDGTWVSVYPLGNATCNRDEIRESLSEGELAVLLDCDGDADFYVTSFNKNNIEPREPTLSFAALSCFFKAVRDYPDMTLDVKYCENMYEIPLGNERPEISVNVGKSKIKCTKTVKFADGIEIVARAVGCGNAIIAALCYDSDLFDEGRLKLLLSSFIGEGAMSAIVVSHADKMRIKTFGQPLIYEAITAGVVALSTEGLRLSDGECVCLVDGMEYVFFKDKGNLTFYPEINLIG
jgi:hypothetical protein